jgi:hypothetical protein
VLVQLGLVAVRFGSLGEPAFLVARFGHRVTNYPLPRSLPVPRVCPEAGLPGFSPKFRLPSRVQMITRKCSSRRTGASWATRIFRSQADSLFFGQVEVEFLFQFRPEGTFHFVVNLALLRRQFLVNLMLELDHGMPALLKSCGKGGSNLVSSFID